MNKMKKLASLLLAAMMMASCLFVPASAAADIHVTIDGKAVVWTDAKPFADENNRTLVPLRAIGEAMGLEVTWDAENKQAVFTGTVTAENGLDLFSKLSFPLNSKTAVTWQGIGTDGDSGTIEMDTAAVAVDGRVYAPARALAEFFGYKVDWDSASSTVVIAQADDPASEYSYLYDVLGIGPETMCIGFFPGPRYDELKSAEMVSASINGKAVKVAPANMDELKALASEYDMEIFNGFLIYGKFDETYFAQDITVSWTVHEVSADGSEGDYTYSMDFYNEGMWGYWGE